MSAASQKANKRVRPAAPDAGTVVPLNADGGDQLRAELTRVFGATPGADKFVQHFVNNYDENKVKLTSIDLDALDARGGDDVLQNFQRGIKRQLDTQLAPLNNIQSIDQWHESEQPPSMAAVPKPMPSYEDASLMTPAQRKNMADVTREIKLLREQMDYYNRKSLQTAQTMTKRGALHGRTHPANDPEQQSCEELSVEEITLMSQQANTSYFNPCSRASNCIGVLVGLAPLAAYMSKSALRVWMRSGMPPAQKHGITMCIRCVIATCNKAAGMFNSNGNHEAVTTPFYVRTGMPGEYKADAVRQVDHKDTMKRPFPYSNTASLYIVERTVQVGAQTMVVRCVADLPNLLCGDQDDAPATMLVRPDHVVSRLPVVPLTLDIVLRNRLADLRYWAGDVHMSLPLRLDMPHQALDAPLGWTPQFQWPSKLHSNRQDMTAGQMQESSEQAQQDAHNAQCLLYTLPLHEGLLLVRYLMAVQDPMLDRLQLTRQWWPLDSHVAGLLKPLGTPDLDLHLMLYLLCGRYHFAQRCIAALRTGRISANHTQTRQQSQSRQASAAQSTSHFISNVEALLDDTALKDSERDARSDQRDEQSIVQPAALLEQLELWCNALMPLIGWYLKRQELKLAYDDRALLCSTPHTEHLKIHECLVPAVGTQQRNCSVYNTWYEMVQPAPSDYLRGGDTLYARPVEQSTTLPASHEVLAYQADDLARTSGVPISDVRRVFCTFFDGLEKMGSYECAQLQVRADHWMPAFASFPYEVRQHVADLLSTPPQPLSRWWTRLSGVPDHYGHLVLATLVDRVNVAWAVLRACQDHACSYAQRLRDQGEQESWRQHLRLLEANCHDLRRFIGSHLQLALVAMSSDTPNDGALMYRPWTAYSKQSALQLYYPRDSLAPVENYMPEIANALCRQLSGNLYVAHPNTGAVKNMLRLSLPVATFVREFQKHIHQCMHVLVQRHLSPQQHANARNASVNEANQLFALLVQFLRVSLFGGYTHCHTTLSFAQALRYESMFQRLQINGDQKARLCQMFSNNQLLTLAIVREACSGAARRDQALLGFMHCMFTKYDVYEAEIVKSMEATRIALSCMPDATLHSVNDALRDVPKLTPVMNKFAVARQSHEDFPKMLGSCFKTVSTDRMAEQLMNRLDLTSLDCPWLPEPYVHWLCAYVQSLEPGSSYQEQWFQDEHSPLRELVSERGQQTLSDIYQARHDHSCKDKIQSKMRTLSPLDYAALSWFYHLLRKHNMRRLMVLDQHYALAQCTAAARCYHLGKHEQLRPHMIQATMCSLLGCAKCKTYCTPKKPGLHLLNCKRIVFDINSGQNFCCANQGVSAQVDQFMRPQVSQDQQQKLRLRDHELKLSTSNRAIAANRKNLLDECKNVARTLLRLLRQRPCDSVSVSDAPTAGHVFFSTTKGPGITICPRCGHATKWSLALFGVNGFSCSYCDQSERRALCAPRCFACQHVVYDYQPKSQDKSQEHSRLPLPVQKVSSIGRGNEKCTTWICPSQTGLGLVHTQKCVLLGYDEHQRCVRPLPVCDQCFKPWFRQELDAHVSIQELAFVVRNGLPRQRLHFTR